MLAVKHRKSDLVELLLENGAGINLQDTDGSTALMCAVEHESLPIAKLLLTRPECDVNIADNVRAVDSYASRRIDDALLAVSGGSNGDQHCHE